MKIPRLLPWLAALLLSVPLLSPCAAEPTPAAPATTAAPAPAPNWYNVELIVFSNTDPNAGSLETWPVNPGAPDWNSAVPPNPTGSGLPYMLLPPSSYRLTSDWQKLAHSSDYQPLLQVAWTQPAIDRSTALFVRIGIPPSSSLPAANSTNAQMPAATPSANGTPVYGIARLSTTGPYLHLDLDLDYRGPMAKISTPGSAQTTAPAGAAPQVQWYRLTQNRRIDAGKLNYFDHPMFGVLLLVTPTKAP
ncbi:MAG: hypothetical protein KGL13_06300 [Gammaproteobacteria bacterium]|nr:hypothetical protein [Gammaproteobacteria bacterium]MDE2346059.1 hypothetical protein [Gammaproteobacteria bacterium]